MLGMILCGFDNFVNRTDHDFGTGSSGRYLLGIRVLFCATHRQSSHANAAYFDYDDATQLYGLFNDSEVGDQELKLLRGLPRASPKQDDRGLLFIAQCQDAAEI